MQRKQKELSPYKERVPEPEGSQRWAHHKLYYAVKTGKVKKPDICSHCKKRFQIGQIEGHHADYSKPFDVEWLCTSCHANWRHGGSFHPGKYVKK